RIEYRAGNSTGSSTFLTPIQRFYGEVQPGVDTADLSLKLVIDQDPIEPGDIVMVDVLAGNAGPDLAGLPSVTIDLPAGYTLLAFDDSDQGTFLPDDMLWKLDDLAGSGPAADALLRLQLQVTQQTPYAIEAQIFAGEFDPDLNNNLALLSPDVLRSRSDLKLGHSVAPAAALPGDQVTFAVLVDNLGPEPADGVEVAHLLPTGYSYQSHNNDLGSYNSATGQWQIGSLDVGEGAVLEVEALVNGSGGFLSSASASSFSEDPEPFNNLAFAEVDPFTDLAVSIEADAEWAGMGDALAMIVQVVNNGPREAPAASVQVQTLSGGFIPFEHFASIGAYEPNSGLWTLGPLAPGARATLVIDGTPGLQMDTELVAAVSSAAFDPEPSNDIASALVRYQFDGPFGQFSPASIDFGEVQVGQSSDSVVITVTSVGDEPLDIGFTTLWGDDDVHFVFDGGSCTSSSPPLNVGETCIVSLRFVPEAAGTWTDAEVRISSNDPNGTYVIPVSGIGLSDSVEDAIFSDRFQGFQ
ncbi:MAG: choice-of-anchor D domain-containing protein, partial [Wenzhouxiangella sp.]|nr:choice-of-anchor D domain-containing protein [Wenzhouxiangella sp.]